MTQRFIIIGAGQAGAQAAISLRQAGFDGEIVMIGGEPAPPYQRPPLSKAYLKGDLAEERLYLRPADFYAAQNIDLRLSDQVTIIDRGAKTVHTEAGLKLAYDKLLIATGAPPRRLTVSGSDLEGVFYLRTHADSNALRAVLTCKGRVVIVGAGYIGLEVAAVARQAGRDVTVLEMADRVLARVASKPVSDFYEKLHADAGVDLRLGATLKGFEGKNGKLSGATLANGQTIDCAAALVGIGAVPEVTLAAEAGLTVANGIVVDDHACSVDEDIYAAGDCTNFPSPRYGRRMRLESVPNAIEQAKVAAANMAGSDVIYDALPWFWSDQYDVKLQTVGLSEGHDELIVRGMPDVKKFSVWYFKNGGLLATDAVNDPSAFAMAKRVLTAAANVDAEKIRDPAVDLKSLLS
ncbi:NAD(P)/FAD-dependent oxidoreductase [Hyphococcus sp.]|uniref:NAD(P)/FAD-dependent oxidoreductase n=1 Tax=Hyphococcus sp. TaxID=2038636 RepID=UPI0035C6DB79